MAWRHEYEANKVKEKLVKARQREKQAAENSIIAYDGKIFQVLYNFINLYSNKIYSKLSSQ